MGLGRSTTLGGPTKVMQHLLNTWPGDSIQRDGIGSLCHLWVGLCSIATMTSHVLRLYSSVVSFPRRCLSVVLKKDFKVAARANSSASEFLVIKFEAVVTSL